jgi:2-polyprenyl-3-methyl-5-hydroxy-6-metoxy-1,4-benzoquinol methylase
MRTDITEVLQKVYNTIEKDYERNYFNFHKYRYGFTLNKLQGLDKNARILDVGCYPPHMMNALTDMGYQVYGIASTHEPIKKAKITVLNIEKDTLPYKSGFFDAIVFSEVMEHLLVNPDIYLSEIKRVLKKKGILLVTRPNAAGLHKIIPILMGRSTYFPLEQLYTTNYGDTSIYHRHNREYTRNELNIVLKRSEFFSRRWFYKCISIVSSG